jgi:hypothetical protein
MHHLCHSSVQADHTTTPLAMPKCTVVQKVPLPSLRLPKLFCSVSERNPPVNMLLPRLVLLLPMLLLHAPSACCPRAGRQQWCL